MALRIRLPHCGADDLCQDAMLVLRVRLARRPDLRLNHQLARDHFRAWVRRLIRRHCLDAVRRNRVRQRTCESLPKDDVLAERKIERWLSDLHEEIGRLPPRERAVVCAYGACGSLAEAAASLGLDYHRARRALRSGIARLRLRYEPAPLPGYVDNFSK